MLRGFPQRIKGTETEYGIWTPGDIKAVTDLLPSGTQRWWFSVYGGCLYRDIGDHLELCTPEEIEGDWCEALSRRMEQWLCGFLDSCEQKLGFPIYLVKNNVAPHEQDSLHTPDATYATHENYLTCSTLSAATAARALAPYFVTRQLWSGSGSVVADADGEWHFQIAQRSRFISKVSSNSTTNERGLVVLRNQPLAHAARFNRFQPIFGDANILFEPAAYKLDITDLMLLLFENNALPELSLYHPIAFLHALARDWRQCARLTDRTRSSGIQIQLIYWRAAQNFVRRYKLASYLPALKYWGDVLAALSEGCLATLRGRVDWVTKLALLERAEQRHGKLSYHQAHKIDLLYHTIKGGNGRPHQLRAKFDPPGAHSLIASPPLPRSRARVRGALIQLANQYNLPYQADWNYFAFMRPGSKGLVPGHPIRLDDPYQTDTKVLQKAEDHARRSLQVQS